MKFILCLNFFSFLLNLVKTDDQHFIPEHYIPLIMNVRKLYTTSAVFFAHPVDKYNDYGDMSVAYTIHTWSRIIGSKGIITLDINYRRMFRVERYYHSIVRPLIIVLIPNLEWFNEFSKATRTFKMAFPSWLVIFMKTQDGVNFSYCHEPRGNPFSLSFNAEMMVVCGGDDNLYEWYSVDGKTTDIFKLASWNSEGDFRYFTNMTLYDRRKDLKGMILRGVTVSVSPFIHMYKGELRGYLGEVFRELAKTINCTFKIVKQTVQYGALNITSKEWSDSVLEVVQSRADIGLADFSMTSNRLDVLDFMVPLITSRSSLYIKQLDFSGVQWSTYFKTFSRSIWLAIIMIILVATLVVSFIKVCLGENNTTRVIIEEFFIILGIFCLQSLSVFPNRTPLRVTYTSMLVTASVIVMAFSACLICFLTSGLRNLPFLSVEEFIKDGSFSLLTVQGSADYEMFAASNDSTLIAMMKLMRPYEELPDRVLNGFQRICVESQLALFSSEEIRSALNHLIPCKLAVISAGRVDSMSMVLTKDNPLTPLLNYQLQKFMSSGVLRRFKSATDMQILERTISYQPVEIFNIITVLILLMGGIVLATVILFIEKLYYSATCRSILFAEKMSKKVTHIKQRH